MGLNNQDKRDIYYYQAKSMGFRARSAFKLMDIDKTYNLLEDVSTVVDLCAAPGSWSQVLSRQTNAKIVAIDIQEMEQIENVIILRDDITSEKCINNVTKIFGDKKADLVLCDGAPEVTGFNEIDEFLQMDLLKSALLISLRLANEGSNLLAKAFEGKYLKYILSHFKKFYTVVRVLKPLSSKSSSSECFILGLGMKKSDFDPFEIDITCNPEDYIVSICGDTLEYSFVRFEE